MAITASTSHQITLAQASVFTARYRATIPVDPSGQFTAPIAFAFGKNDMVELLNQSGAVGFRVYGAINDDEGQCLVITAIDSNNNDMQNGLLLEFSEPCPSSCSRANELNSTT